VRLLTGDVELSSAMPIIPRWVLPYTPHVPPVVALDHDRAMDFSAAYVLPLRETHPYPAEPIARAPVPHADEVASRLSLTIGFFPEMDENELHSRSDGKQIPSYYQLRRQFLVTASVTGLSIPATRPLWSGA
jgi:hypothetical protein